jgi:putative sigma-54 modulation protein
MELTDAMREYIAKAVEQLDKYNLDIIAAKSIIEDDSKHGKPQTLVEFTIHLAHRDTIVIKHADKDFYAAVDLAVERAKKVLRRYKDKISDKIGKEVPHKHDIPATHADLEEGESEIIPAEPEHTFSQEEAAAYLKETNYSFVAFMEKGAGKLRVLYRRKDGKLGLY